MQNRVPSAMVGLLAVAKLRGYENTEEVFEFDVGDWHVSVNGAKVPLRDSGDNEVPAKTAFLRSGGYPAGSISIRGGLLMGYGGPGDMERDLIAACEAELTATSSPRRWTRGSRPPTTARKGLNDERSATRRPGQRDDQGNVRQAYVEEQLGHVFAAEALGEMPQGMAEDIARHLGAMDGVSRWDETTVSDMILKMAIMWGVGGSRKEAEVVRTLAGEWGEMEVGPTETVEDLVKLLDDKVSTIYNDSELRKAITRVWDAMKAGPQ